MPICHGLAHSLNVVRKKGGKRREKKRGKVIPRTYVPLSDRPMPDALNRHARREEGGKKRPPQALFSSSGDDTQGGGGGGGKKKGEERELSKKKPVLRVTCTRH